MRIYNAIYKQKIIRFFVFLSAIFIANCALQPIYGKQNQQNQFQKIILQKPNTRIEQLVYNEIYPISAQNSQYIQYKIYINIRLINDKPELNNQEGEPSRQVVTYQIKWHLEEIKQQNQKINGTLVISAAYVNDEQNKYRNFVTSREHKQVIAKEIARQIVDDVNVKIYIQKHINDRNS